MYRQSLGEEDVPHLADFLLQCTLRAKGLIQLVQAANVPGALSIQGRDLFQLQIVLLQAMEACTHSVDSTGESIICSHDACETVAIWKVC